MHSISHFIATMASSSSKEDFLPDTPYVWVDMARKHGVQFVPIHELDSFASGSKIEMEQFLALRVIWKPTIGPNCNFEKDWGIKSRLARDRYLSEKGHWLDYVKHIETNFKKDARLGTFDMLYDFQLEIDNLSLDVEAEGTHKIFSPTVRRSKRLAAPANENRSVRDPTTPTPGPKKDAVGVDALDFQALSLEPPEPKTPESGKASSEIQSCSPMTIEEAKLAPVVEDEQIVNTALILLLRGICMRVPEIASSQWTLQRKAFNFMLGNYEARSDEGHTEVKEFEEKPEDEGNRKGKGKGKGKGKRKEKNEGKNEEKGEEKDKEKGKEKGKDKGKKLFEARTDGHLAISINDKKRSLSLLEVKANYRSRALPQWQESAQMAAWIQAEPDEETDTENKIFR